MRKKISLPSRLAMSAAVATATLSGYGGRKAYAGSCTGAAGSYVCSGAANVAGGDGPIVFGTAAPGPNTVTNDGTFGHDTSATNVTALDIRTPPLPPFRNGVNLDVNLGDANITSQRGSVRIINQSPGGDLRFVSTGNLTSGPTGGSGVLVASTRNTKGGNVYASVYNVTHTTPGRAAFQVINQGAGSITVVTQAGGTVDGSATQNGIEVYNDSSRFGGISTDISITTNGDVLGGGNGIYARNDATVSAGSTTIETNGTVTGGTYNGIWANNRGGMTTTLDITTNGDVSGSYGINTRHSGIGATTITTVGKVTGTAGDGIYTSNYGTSLTVTTGAGKVMGSNHGVEARNNGTGGLAIMAGGDVTGETGHGISAYNSASATTASMVINQAAGTTTMGASNGVNANNFGGSLTINALGTSIGLAGSGIYANNNVGTTDLTITANEVTGATYGIYTKNRGVGSTSITTTGLVTGAASDGIYSYSDMTTTGATLNIGGDVSGATNGVNARHYGAGSLDVTVSSAITGAAGNGIETRTDIAGAGNVGTSNITLNAGANVSGGTNAIFNDAGASNTVVNAGAVVTGAISLGDGSDNLTFAGADPAGVTLFDGGDDADVADGFIDVLTLNGVTATLNGGNIVNWEVLNLIDSITTITDLVRPTLNVCGGSTTLGGAGMVTDVLGCISDDAIEVTDDTVIANIIEGAGGADTIVVSGNASVTTGVYGGGNGQDASAGADGNDTIVINTTGVVGLVDAGAGDDTVDLLSGTITTDVFGRVGNDTITLAGASITNMISGGAGEDMIDLTSGTADSVDGGAENDNITLAGASITNMISGGAGEDMIDLTSGTAGSVDGGAENDNITLAGANITNMISGGAGEDMIDLTSGTADSVDGGAENDTIVLDGAIVAGEIAGGTGDDSLVWSSGNLARFNGNDGSDIVTITATEFNGTQILDGGDDTDIADGFIDTLTFNGVSAALTGANIQNWENVVIGAGSVISFVDNMLAVGSAAGTGLTNRGVLTMQNGMANDALAISGNYIGAGGILAIDTVLGDGASATDKLLVSGNTSGTSVISVNNLGGSGGATGTGATDGIKVVEVGGTSAGTFALSGELIVGAHQYNLIQADRQNWYLQSALLAQVDGYRVLPSIFNHNIGTFHQRVGLENQSELRGLGANNFVGNSASSAWVRIVGGNRDIAPDGYASFDEDKYFLQAGFDQIVSQNAKGRWALGINALTGKSDVSVNNVAGRNVSNVDSDFYGFGLTATWYGNNSYYADFVAQYTKYDANFTSIRSRSNIDGDNFAFSAEFGKHYHPWANRKDLSLVPQAQLIFSSAHFDTFTDANGVVVSLDDGDTLTGRIGLMLESRKAESNKFVGFVGANLYLNLAGDTTINASGTVLDYIKHDGWIELSAGGTYKLNQNLDLYGQLNAGTSIDDFGDSSNIRGELGLRGSW